MFLKQLTKLSLRAQIAWLAANLIIMTTLLLTINYWLTTASYVEQQMYFAQNVLKQNLKQQEQVLVTSANVLTADFDFKQAVATQDTKTLQSALLNHGQPIKADLMVLIDLNGEFIASNNNSYSSEQLRNHLNALPLKAVNAQMLVINDSIYQIILAPVKAPRTIAYAIIGFRIYQNTLTWHP